MIAGLVRALARTCYRDAMRGTEIEHVRSELLRSAKWRAARYGLDADLIDVHDRCARPASELLEKFLAALRPALEEHEEWDEVQALVRETAARGTGATRQRAAYAQAGRHEDVVDLIVAETARGTN